MKKFKIITGSLMFSLILFFFMSVQEAACQQALLPSPPIPDNLNKIFANSCTPCHMTKGKAMAKSFVNFDEWTKYTPEKQAKKANMILYVLNKEKMPPKAAIENRPNIILTKEQIALVKKWADSLQPATK